MTSELIPLRRYKQEVILNDTRFPQNCPMSHKMIFIKIYKEYTKDMEEGGRGKRKNFFDPFLNTYVVVVSPITNLKK